MNKTEITEIIKVLEMITQDAKDDAANFDGRIFNGKTVAEYFGNHGAAIAALAKIIKLLIEEKDDNPHLPTISQTL